MNRYGGGRWNGARWYRDRYRGQGGLLGGIILAGIGVLLLLQNLGIPFFDDLERYWPLILIVVGVSHAVRSVGTGGLVWGGAISVAGAILLLNNFGLIHGDVWRFLWPGILIMIGLAMLARSLDRQGPGGSPSAAAGPDGANASSLDRLNEWAVFGGTRRRIDTQDFQGGDAFAMFGGVELDLRKAGSTRKEILIEANALFGGIEMRVPENWNITVRGSGIFGGYEDKTMDSRLPPDATQPHLIVNGFAVFGGVTIQN